MAEKKIRLNKVLKELNISTQRAIDFLTEQGIALEASPNAKISESTQEVLIKQFRSDMEQKAASEEVSIQKKQEKEELIRATTKQEPTKVVKAKAETLKGPKTVGKIDLNLLKKTKKNDSIKVEPVQNSNLELVEAVKLQKEPKLAPIEQQAIEPTIKLEDSPSKASALETSKDEPILEKSTNAKKESEEIPQIAQEIESTQNQAPVVKEESDDLEKAPIQQESQQPNQSKQRPDDSGVIETKYTKLQGPRLTGQSIDLSQFQDRKKKRKRIKKEVKVDPIQPKQAADESLKKGVAKKPIGIDNRKLVNKPGASNRPKKVAFQPRKTVELSDEEIKNQIKETLEKLTGGKGKSKGSKHRREKRQSRREKSEIEEEKRSQDGQTLKVTEFVTVNELATMMDKSVNEIIMSCMSLGIMVTMNQRLDAEILTLVAEEFGYQVVFIDAEVEEAVQEEVEDKPEDLMPRPPVVTIMGHVDHGKTSLLDYIRDTNVIAGEAGGITQHIGAYNVEIKQDHSITFLDTPGHEAFTAMRARGAQLTDIAIIVIAADDQVMPQTKEAISHAQAAGVPMIFAINKIDKPAANAERIKEQLAQMNLLVEDWGGKIQVQEISAKKGTGVKDLLDKVILEAELLELKANPNKPALGTIVEASLDKGRGYVANLLVQAGTLRVGDYVLAGVNSGKVRAMLDERGHIVGNASPSMPIAILGLDGAPQAGDKFKVFSDEREAKQLATKRSQLIREQSVRAHRHITLDEIGRRIALGNFRQLNLILKGDVDGSVEALSDALQKLSTEQIVVNIVYKAVGQITDSDVLLASASDAIIIGFNVRPSNNARTLSDKEEVEIRQYAIIYDVINEIKEAMEGMLAPEIKEKVLGTIEVRELFKVSKIGVVAGCMVISGKVTRQSKIRVIREGVVVYTSELSSLKRFKDDAKEVTKGYECGLMVHNYNQLQQGDTLEAYEEVSVKRKL